ncbi:unnamed protein product [Auanema sp. JU1783]|nr:unnamed protein product [Auanema sp. JU1783]
MVRSHRFLSERRKIQKNLYLLILGFLLLVFGITTVFTWLSVDVLANQRNVELRVKRSTSDCIASSSSKKPENDLFPTDLFSLETRQQGAVIFHLAGLVYMFIALAVVCDEFFVPSLSVLRDYLSISDDVAGATFMAAGGSAPEFFTSLFGVFITQNNVGIGTIVGSATFNILCVLAFCTLFSRKVLHLTWWPLFRDMAFYYVALIFLVIFFSDEQISWHEALCMFLIYVFYGLFMKYNSQMEILVKSWLTSNSVQETVDVNFNREPRRSIPLIHGGGAQLRNGLAQMVIHDEVEDDTSSSERSQPSSTKVIRVKPAEEKLFTPTNTGTTITTISGSIASRSNNKIAPVEIIEKETSNGKASKVQSNGNGNQIHVPPLEMDKLSVSSREEQPLDLSWPETTLKQIIYVGLLPIMLPLACTLPDVRKPTLHRFFLITFVGSILWIALFSYLMVWWANTIGETFRIPTEIMGLTILAAGTSIPDLITSVIVARKGLGDMAVSSSIGSNLFDICIGLPIPWLLFFLVALLKGSETVPTVPVVSKGLICSVGLLFVMLLLLVVCIALSKWKMDKYFGFTMIVSYLTFCIISIFLETGMLTCPLRVSSVCQ